MKNVNLALSSVCGYRKISLKSAVLWGFWFDGDVSAEAEDWPWPGRPMLLASWKRRCCCSSKDPCSLSAAIMRLYCSTGLMWLPPDSTTGLWEFSENERRLFRDSHYSCHQKIYIDWKYLNWKNSADVEFAAWRVRFCNNYFTIFIKSDSK